MPTYTIHEPPHPPADRIDRAERLEFVRDGFSWIAFLFTPLWMLAHRLWLPFVALILGFVILAAVARPFDAGKQWAPLIAFAVQAILGFEAASLRRWGLDRRGWRMVGSVTGRNLADCERRFFTAWLPSQPVFSRQEAPVSGRTIPTFARWRGLLGREA